MARDVNKSTRNSRWEKAMKSRNLGRDLERLDRTISTLAAFGTFGFFFAVIAYGWYQTFLMMAA